MTLPKRLRLSKFLALATIAIALIFTLVSQDSYAASTEPADQAGPVPEHGSGCHTRAHRPSSVTVTQSPTNAFEASIAWTDADNNSGCTTHFDYVLYYLGPVGRGPNSTVIAITRTVSTLPVDVDLSATGNGVYRAFARVVRFEGDEERTGGWAYTNYLLFEDDTVEPPLAPRVRWNPGVDDRDWQCTRAHGCTTSISLTIVQQPGDTRNYSIQKYAATHRRGNEAAISYAHDTNATTDDIPVTSHTRSHARARWAIHDSDSNDLWSEWSPGTSITPVPSQSALNSRLSGGTRRFPLAQQPSNFTAAYNADEGNTYDITFDVVKKIADTDESWSGGLAVERYQWATSQRSSGCPNSARWLGINTSPHPTDSDKLTAKIAVPPHLYLAIRAVTLAGNGTCAIAATTGNPVSPPTLDVRRDYNAGGQHLWVCDRTTACTADYRIVPNDPANESPSTRYKINITSSRDFNEEPDTEFSNNFHTSSRVRSETITVRLQRRVGDAWSDWSPPFNYTTSMTPEQISRDAYPARRPPNIAADYDEDSDRYTLSFDTLFPSIGGRDPIAWSGGLPIIYYEYGKVEPNDHIRNNSCPTGGADSDGEPIERAALGTANPVGEATRVSVTSYMGYAHKVWARGVTLWGRGNCAVVTPTNNPTSLDETPSPSAPKKPTNLTYTISGGNVVLDWDAPDDDSVTGYSILRRKPVTQNQLLIYVRDTGNTDTTYTDTDAPAGEYYVYRVQALNSQGVASPRSNYVNVDRR